MTAEALRTPPADLRATTVELDRAPDLLACLPPSDAVAWVRNGQGLVGWGVAARIELGSGVDRISRAAEAMRMLGAAVRTGDAAGRWGEGLVGFASFTFDPQSTGSVLIVPRVLVGRDGDRAWMTTIGEVERPDLSGRPGAPGPTGVRFLGSTVPDAVWQRSVTTAAETIRNGALRKVVLARDEYVEAAGDIDARAVASRLAQRYPGCFTYLVDGLVGATPELLVRRREERVESLVLAGTAARGADDDADAALGAQLLASAKNLEEHALAAASVVSVLQERCVALSVPRGPGLLKLANAQHLATRLTGRLRRPESALDLVAALHPSAAVCGTPTDAALGTIRQLEGMDRGRYSGPVGWMDAAGNGEFGIALRCAQISGRQARLFAGNGIMGASDPAAELAETDLKLDAVRSALR